MPNSINFSFGRMPQFCKVPTLRMNENNILLAFSQKTLPLDDYIDGLRTQNPNVTNAVEIVV